MSVAAAAREQALFDWPTTAAAAKADKVKNAAVVDRHVIAPESRLIPRDSKRDATDRQFKIDSDADDRSLDETGESDEIFAELVWN